jgi:hypothetical protein
MLILYYNTIYKVVKGRYHYQFYYKKRDNRYTKRRTYKDKLIKNSFYIYKPEIYELKLEHLFDKIRLNIYNLNESSKAFLTEFLTEEGNKLNVD